MGASVEEFEIGDLEAGLTGVLDGRQPASIDRHRRDSADRLSEFSAAERGE
jgi:hypothetical protein